MGRLTDWLRRRITAPRAATPLTGEPTPPSGEAPARVGDPRPTTGGATARPVEGPPSNAAAAAAAGAAVLAISLTDALVADRAVAHTPDPNDPASAGPRAEEASAAAANAPAPAADDAGGQAYTFDLGWGDGGGGADGGDA